LKEDGGEGKLKEDGGEEKDEGKTEKES